MNLYTFYWIVHLRYLINVIMKKIFVLFIVVISFSIKAQYNYFNFSSAPINTTPFTSAGDGMVLTPSNELYFRSAYGCIGVSRGWNNWDQIIVWGTQVPKTTSELIYGDNKIFYVDENNRLRQLYWDAGTGQWVNYELNYASPPASGTGLVWAGNSTLYYTSATSPYPIYKMYYSGSAWVYESTGTYAKFNSRIAYGDNKLIYLNAGGRVRNVYKSSSTWISGELNTGSPAARGDGLVFGANSNIYYTTTAGNICNMFYNGSWNFNVVSNAVTAKSGSKILCDNNTLYYVGSDNYLYTLLWDNCDWFNKKISKTVTPKAEAICFGNNQIFFRNNSDNVIYNAKTQTSTSQSYVYLKGKTFYNGSTPFYPVVMNYLLNLNSTDAGPGGPNPNAPEPNLTNLWVSPHHGTFLNNYCTATDQTSANVFLAADFARLKSLGFNTLRLCGLDVVYNKTGTEDTKIQVMNEPYAAYPYNTNYTANNKQKLFDAISDILTLANNAGLKVILLTGGNYPHRNVADPADPSAIYGLAWSNYCSYLTDLTSYFKNNPAILAYDLWNEPGNQWDLDNGKQSNCFQSKSWYDAVRAGSMNQLVTMGLFGGGDLLGWDPNILSVDFLSFHDYGWPFDSNLNNYQNRYLSNIKWIQNTIKTPWIIGETSVSAINNATANCTGNANIGWNTEAEQQQFAIFSQTTTRSAGGSGYSWWAYHDVGSGPYTTAPIEAYEGIYSICDRKKPAADEFNENHNWLNYPCNNLPTPADIDYYGYDPNANYTYTVSGKLVDGNNGNAPIKDGLIVGWDINYKAFQTYSKSDGTFKLCTNSPNQLVAMLKFTALGKDIYGPLWCPYGTCTGPFPQTNPLVLSDVALYNVSSCSISNNVRLASVKENINLDAIEVYPNPSSNYIIVKNNFLTDFKIEIYDMLGKQLFANNYFGGNSNVRIDYNDYILNNNFVIIKVSDGNSTINKKVLIMK
jgi:hypothetical protein